MQVSGGLPPQQTRLVCDTPRLLGRHLLLLQLPVTLLYDHQSINAIVDYISGVVEEAAAAAASGARAPGNVPRRHGTASTEADAAGVGAAAPPGAGRPSDLLKTLRPPPAQRALFLAAPGVANAQSAYFSFSQFLQASGQGCAAVRQAHARRDRTALTA